MTVLEDILSQEIIQKLGWTLLHFIWQAAVAALLLAILLRVLRKSTPSLRYIIACMALGLIVLLPVITIQLVPASVPQSPAHIEPAPVPAVLLTEEMPAAETIVLEEPVQPESVALVSADSWKQRAVDTFEPALPYIVSGWLLGVFGLSIWHLGGWAQLQRLRRKMVKQVDDTLHNKLKDLAERLKVNRTVQLVESALVQIPTVVGWLRPVILLPASALTGLSAEQLEAILAHELAHIKRFDYLLNILQTVVEILGFYHPAVWWVSHKIRAERENCCDDLAVSISGDRVCYARALTSMEEIRTGRGQLAVAASGGNLFKRIRRLVSKDSTEKTGFSWVPAATVILLIIALAIPTTLALTAHDKTEHSAQFLLDKMLEHRSRVKNLQYIAVATGRDGTDEFIKWMEDRIKKRREEGASERDIGFSERSLERIKSWRKEHENRYETIKCTIDNEGRSKTELTRGDYDASGKKMPGDYKLIRAWNGIQSVEFYQKRGSLEATLEATIKDVPSASIHPWRLFISTLCQCLEETIEAKRDVSVEKLKDGTYRIAFDYTTKRRIVAVIDPSKGYTCALREDLNDQGKCTSRYTSTYEEVAEGIWFPVSGQLETFSSDSPNYKRSFKSSQIRINGPAFNASYFDVDMPKGTTVMDEVHGKQYVVGSKRVHDLNVPQNSSAETEEVDPNSWQEKFYSIYRLEDGQVLKRIAPPFIPERREYFKLAQPGRYSANTPYYLAKQFIFRWDGDLNIRNMHMGGGIPRLSTTLGSAFGLGRNEYDIPLKLLNMDMSGDWIKRKDTPQEELLRALEQIIKEETGKEIHFVKREVESKVIVARGTYRLTPLPNTKKKDCVHVYTDKLDTYSGAGGGSGTVSKFLRFVGNRRIKTIIIDKTESGDVELSWRNHYSSDLSRLEHNEQLHNEKVDMLLNNLTRQTGLTFERGTAPVEKWFIAEQESSAESFPVPVLVKSPAPPDEDKAHVQVDCLIIEVFTDLKMDWETTIIAENLLGNKISLRDTKVDVLLRKAAGATAATKDKSAENKRVTQDQFKALTDMLTSRGYIKILMNPVLEVINGKTAKISSSQHVPLQVITKTIPGAAGLTTIVSTETEYIDVVDSLEITPHVFADGRITLQVEAAINSKSIPKGVEQIPIITTREVSTLVRISPGESLIIGMKRIEKGTEADSNAKDSQEQTTEVLLILTPTIITPATDSQEKTDMRIKVKPDKTSGKLAANRAFFTPPIARIINSAVERKDCFIDFDNDKLYSPPSDFHLRARKQQEAWKRENGIDASATVSEGAEGLWGEEMVIIPLANVDFDRMTPASFRDFLKQATPGTPAVMTAIGQLPKTYVFKTREDGMGLLQILEVQRKRSPHYIKIRYKMVPRTVEADVKITSNKKLQDLGKAMVMFARDHQRKLPDSLQDFAPYLRNKRDIKWLSQKVKYLGKGKTENDRPDTVIAYDSSLLLSQQGTNVLFLDAHVEFCKPDRLTELGISKPKEAIGMDPAEKAVYKQLETIIVDLSELTPTTSFSDAIEVIRNSVDPPLEIDVFWRDLLKNADIKPDTAINMDGLPEVPLGTGLESLLKAVASGFTKLNYVVENGVIRIGTLRFLPHKMYHGVYDISGLVGTAADADSLIRRITETIEPDSWYNLSETGEGTIMAYPLRQPKKFAVLQTRKIHQKIKRFLDDMSSSRDELPEPNLTLAPKVPLITSTFIDGDLIEVLRDIASMAGITIIPDEKVVGLVTAELQDVPLETALDIVLADTPYVVKKTPYYYLVASAVELPEITTRIESAKKLSNLGKALLIYANDHEDKYPNSLHTFTEYLKWEDFSWIRENVEYLAPGKTIADRPDTVIAYDKKLLAERKGTNVLFNDSHVEFVKPEKLKELGISATEILIETRLLMVSEDFLKDIGLDANSVDSSGAWSEHLVADSAAEPNSETYSLILDKLHISFLLKAVQAHQGSKMLVSPRVTVLEGKEARIATQSAIHYISGYNEPNRPSDKPVPKLDKVELGTRLWLKPELTPDNQNIKLDFKMEIRQLLGYEERKYKGKYPYKIPKVDVVSTKMPCLIPDGKTLLIVGLKKIEQVEHQSDAPRLSDLPLIGVVFSRSTKTRDNKILLVLVKPIINPQQKASKILPGEEDSEEHIKHLGRLLEKKLTPPAEPK